MDHKTYFLKENKKLVKWVLEDFFWSNDYNTIECNSSCQNIMANSWILSYFSLFIPFLWQLVQQSIHLGYICPFYDLETLTCYIVISYFLYFSQKTKKFIPKAVVYGAWRWKTHTASFLASWTPLCIAVASICTSPWPSTSSLLSFTPIKEDGVACANRKVWKFSSSLCSLRDGLHEQNFGRGAAKLCG